MLGVTLYRRCQPEADNNPWGNPLNTVGIPATAPGDKLHHKFATIDDRVVISGSHNWSQAANQNNDEVLIAIDNPTVARHFVREFDRLYSSLSIRNCRPKLKISSNDSSNVVNRQYTLDRVGYTKSCLHRTLKEG